MSIDSAAVPRSCGFGFFFFPISPSGPDSGSLTSGISANCFLPQFVIVFEFAGLGRSLSALNPDTSLHFFGGTSDGLTAGGKSTLDSGRFQDEDFLRQTSRNHLRQGNPEWSTRIVRLVPIQALWAMASNGLRVFSLRLPARCFLPGTAVAPALIAGA